MKVAKGRITVIAHVAATSTRDSIELAKHAEECGVDAIVSIPPIYFRLPEHAIESYWNSIANATNLDFIIYNIPQTFIYAMCGCHGNLYAVMKTILKIKGMDIGGVRLPLAAVIDEDMPKIGKCAEMIDKAIKKYC